MRGTQRLSLQPPRLSPAPLKTSAAFSCTAEQHLWSPPLLDPPGPLVSSWLWLFLFKFYFYVYVLGSVGGVCICMCAHACTDFGGLWVSPLFSHVWPNRLVYELSRSLLCLPHTGITTLIFQAFTTTPGFGWVWVGLGGSGW